MSQIITLIYTMDNEANNLLTALKLMEFQKKYNATRQKFEVCFMKRHNHVFKQAKFNLRKQKESELVDGLTTLYCLVVYCDYRELHNEMITD